MKEQAEQAEKIATVLGMLELTKIKVATIIQRRPFGNIALKKREPTYDDLQYLQPADKTI